MTDFSQSVSQTVTYILHDFRTSIKSSTCIEKGPSEKQKKSKARKSNSATLCRRPSSINMNPPERLVTLWQLMFNFLACVDELLLQHIF